MPLRAYDVQASHPGKETTRYFAVRFFGARACPLDNGACIRLVVLCLCRQTAKMRYVKFLQALQIGSQCFRMRPIACRVTH